MYRPEDFLGSEEEHQQLPLRTTSSSRTPTDLTSVARSMGSSPPFHPPFVANLVSSPTQWVGVRVGVTPTAGGEDGMRIAADGAGGQLGSWLLFIAFVRLL
ncbi:hypothetical protein GUJ93_ZPchr0067g6547 [Zizania palustris]|uniref:Uncharacterized protein n=1 Tax=Zizania palustris TaxID=103762 RepID=A0A8J5VEN1_ZIZPA|nr:hypothetical protein GUJ93_ZPchr0067g6547 [Zizania palustris]